MSKSWETNVKGSSEKRTTLPKNQPHGELPQLDDYIEVLRFTADQLLECMTFGHYDPRNRKVDHYEEVLERAVEIHFTAFVKLLGETPSSERILELRSNLEIAKDCLHTEWRGLNMMDS